jgi:hypothetical protein
MPVPHVSTAFGDLLDPRFQKIRDDEYGRLPDMLPSLYNFEPSNGRNTMQWSSVGSIADFSEFSGTIGYESQSQGYDTTLTYVEFANGIQIERKLFDDDQYNVMDQRPRAIAASAYRTRQAHGARIFNNMTTVDNYFANNTEGVSLVSNSHTTTSGASTASGFDNLVTTALSAVAVAAARIQMVGFRGDVAERIAIMPDELWYGPDLAEQAYEIIAASGKVDTALNNPNFHQGKYKGYEWNFMNDTNNWAMCDSAMRRMSLHWVDRVGLEFGMIEDFDTMVAKWRAYMRYGAAWIDWRWILGAAVA